MLSMQNVHHLYEATIDDDKLKGREAMGVEGYHWTQWWIGKDVV